MSAMSGRAMILSGAGFAVAAVVFGSTLVDAWNVGEARAGAGEAPVPAGLSPAGPESGDLGTDAVGRYSEAAEPLVSYEAFMQAVEGDPFQPNRTAPATRYRLPGERVERTAAVEAPEIEAPDLRVVGSAVIGRGGLALIQVEDQTPIAVGVGESVQGYRVAAVTAEGATLVGPAGRLLLAITEPTTPRASGDDDRSNRGRNTDDLEQAQRNLQDLMRQLRGRANAGGRATFQGRGRGGRGGGGAFSTPEPSAPEPS